MSHIPTQRFTQTLHANEDLQKDLLLAKTYRIVAPYFKAYKNPKIFLFFMELVRRSLEKNQSKTFFNILEASYEFEVCEKTIKAWITQLKTLKLLTFHFKKKQLYFVEVVDCATIEAKQAQEAQAESNTQKPKQLPTRFYKNVRLILKQLLKSQEFEGKQFHLPSVNISSLAAGSQWHISAKTHEKQNTQRMKKFNKILFDFQNATDSQMSITQTYESLTGKSIPPISNPYHKQMIRANLKHSLKKLIA